MNGKITLTLLALTVYSFFAMLDAQAIELYNYKDNSTVKSVYTKQTLNTLWKSSQPACIKDGAKLIGVNKAYMKNDLGYRDCSSSKSRKKVHKALGFSVVVVKLHELPTELIREIKGKK